MLAIDKAMEPTVHPDHDLILAVSGELRELICDEIPAYWYSWLALSKEKL